MSWREVKQRLLQAFVSEMRILSGQINAPADSLPKLHDDNGMDCTWIDIEGPAPVYCLCYRERGDTVTLMRSANADEVMEYIFSGITQTMAMSYEAAHRILGQDPRRQLFKVQDGLMRDLKPEWGDNEAARHLDILKRSPFVDNEV